LKQYELTVVESKMTISMTDLLIPIQFTECLRLPFVFQHGRSGRRQNYALDIFSVDASTLVPVQVIMWRYSPMLHGIVQHAQCSLDSRYNDLCAIDSFGQTIVDFGDKTCHRGSLH
jgi:hypothetical protein